MEKSGLKPEFGNYLNNFLGVQKRTEKGYREQRSRNREMSRISCNTGLILTKRGCKIGVQRKVKGLEAILVNNEPFKRLAF